MDCRATTSMYAGGGLSGKVRSARTTRTASCTVVTLGISGQFRTATARAGRPERLLAPVTDRQSRWLAGCGNYGAGPAIPRTGPWPSAPTTPRPPRPTRRAVNGCPRWPSPWRVWRRAGPTLTSGGPLASVSSAAKQRRRGRSTARPMARRPARAQLAHPLPRRAMLPAARAMTPPTWAMLLLARAMGPAPRAMGPAPGQ